MGRDEGRTEARGYATFKNSGGARVHGIRLQRDRQRFLPLDDNYFCRSPPVLAHVFRPLQGFSQNTVANAVQANEVLLSIGAESPEEVDELAKKSAEAGRNRLR